MPMACGAGGALHGSGGLRRRQWPALLEPTCHWLYAHVDRNNEPQAGGLVAPGAGGLCDLEPRARAARRPICSVPQSIPASGSPRGFGWRSLDRSCLAVCCLNLVNPNVVLWLLSFGIPTRRNVNTL